MQTMEFDNKFQLATRAKFNRSRSAKLFTLPNALLRVTKQ